MECEGKVFEINYPAASGRGIEKYNKKYYILYKCEAYEAETAGL